MMSPNEREVVCGRGTPDNSPVARGALKIHKINATSKMADQTTANIQIGLLPNSALKVLSAVAMKNSCSPLIISQSANNLRHTAMNCFGVILIPSIAKMDPLTSAPDRKRAFRLSATN